MGKAVMEDAVTETLLLGAQTADEEIRLMAAGEWTAANAAELERRLEAVACGASTARPAVVDMQAIGRFDSYGALLLERLSRVWAGRGQSMRVVEASAPRAVSP